MNATLWVIWISAVVLSGSIGLAVGGWYFPNATLLRERYWDGRRDEVKARASEDGILAASRQQALDAAWRDGYEQGCGDELASCVPCDSPGPGLPHLESRRDGAVYLAPVDFVFVPANPGPPPSPIFDQLSGSWPQLATPLASPPGGVAPEPPAPAMVPGEMPGLPSLSPAHETAGAGADVWAAIAATLDEDPELNEWAIRAEAQRCAEITRELQQLARTLEAT